MKKILSLSLLISVTFGCGSAPQVQQSQPSANANVSLRQSGNTATVSTHSLNTEKSAAQETAKNTKPTTSNQSASNENSPMAKPIDVTEMTLDIRRANKAYRKNQTDEKAKEGLAKAYFERAFALTEAAQYRAALGDFRKGLKLAPNDAGAQKMHDEILRIFASIQREPPKEGEEPAPMPFEKKSE